MSAIKTAEDLLLLRESVDVEFKTAAGRDGKGAVPESMWETYSAFANTIGGTIYLGVAERKDGIPEITGIEDVARVRRDLFNIANNPDKVSANVLTDDTVRALEIDGKTVIEIEILRARRPVRPVFLNGNPLGNTYRRQNESDQRLPDELVKRMLAEQIDDSRDGRVLTGFGIDDLDEDTLKVYRQVFSNRDPAHPWNEIADLAFLSKVGGWRKNRGTGEEGLTLAGLLMFGTHVTIQEELPNYMLDYQEQDAEDPGQRWTDRVTLDGKWSGNLYDFYRRVYAKLTDDLKVPFELKDGERQDDTPVHVALREALANVLVHADYSDRAPVLVVKRAAMLRFRNPGLMRIPPQIALAGGEHDCRNRILHQMFRYVGIGEQAGSGIPKILQGWQQNHWKQPSLTESIEPFDQTVLELHMLDLFPDGVIEALQSRFHEEWERLDEIGRTALAVAMTEGTVNHSRLSTLCDAHPVDLSRVLQDLTHSGFLDSTGGRGAVYHLPGEAPATPEEVFGRAVPEGAAVPSSPHCDPSSSVLDASSPVLNASSPHLDASSPVLPEGKSQDEVGRLLHDRLTLPLVDNLDKLTNSFRSGLETLANEPRNKGKLDQEIMISVIKEVCWGHFITLRSLAELLDRKPNPLRERYLSRLVKDRILKLAFPATPNHELQAYTTFPAADASESEDSEP